MRILLLLSVFLLVFGCGKDRQRRKLIPENELVELLVELHMFDAISTDHTFNTITGDLDSLTVYESVLAKYHTDKNQFDKTLEWYSHHSEKLSKIYDEVFGKINRSHQKWSDQLDLFNQNSSVELFKTEKYIDTRGDSVFYPDPFLVELDSLGDYLIDIRIRLLADDASVNPKLVCYFLNNKKEPSDSLEVINVPLVKSNFTRDYQFKIEHTDNTYKYLKMTVPQVENDSMVFRKNLQLSSLKVMRMIEENKVIYTAEE